jgi:hypothetical protein
MRNAAMLVMAMVQAGILTNEEQVIAAIGKVKNKLRS